MKKYIFFLIIFFITLGVFSMKEAKAGPGDNISGWAWSENVGWISFNSLNCDTDGDGEIDLSAPAECVSMCDLDQDGVIDPGAPAGCTSPRQIANYGVNVDLATGNLSDYTWSANVGWISFNSAELIGCPDGDCPARLDIDGTRCPAAVVNQVCGWARACTVFADPDACSGALDPDRGGWDGWIKLRGQTIDFLNDITLVDGGAVLFTDISIAIGTDGYPVISYGYDVLGPNLRVAKQVAPGTGNCGPGSSWRCTTVWSRGGEYSSIAVPSDGNPVVASYYGSPSYNLIVTKCDDDVCSSNARLSVDSAGTVGRYTSIAIGADDLPVISYFDDSNGDLKVAKCGNDYCNAGNIITTVDDPAPGDPTATGRYNSIAIPPPTAPDQFPVISYYDWSGDLKVAKCGNASCSAGNIITPVDTGGSVGAYTSIAVPSDGLPVISYYDWSGDLKVAKCGNASCSAGNIITPVDTGGSVGTYTSIAIGADDLPVISYLDNTNNDLKVAKCGNASCSAGNIITPVDTGGIVGAYTSIAIGADDLPVISYFDNTNKDLKVAHCGAPDCVEITSVDYGVSFISPPDPNENEFEGWASSDMVVGWTSFNWKNCDIDDNGFIDVACGGDNDATTPVTSDYKVFILPNQAPSASNLDLTPSAQYCGLFPGTGAVFFEWIYTDFEGDFETQFDFRVNDVNDPDQTGGPPGPGVAEVDRTINGGLLNPSPTTNAQSVDVQGTLNGNNITWGTSYYWWVRVWDDQGNNSDWIQYNDPADPDGDGFTDRFTTPLHAYPWPDFTWFPQSFSAEEIIQFCSTVEVGVCEAPEFPADLAGCYAASCTWAWDFENDGTDDSAEQNPTWSYPTEGNYTVKLAMTDSDGYSCPAKTYDLTASKNTPRQTRRIFNSYIRTDS